MSNLVIFCVGLFASALCVLFVVISAKELRRAGAQADARAAGAQQQRHDSQQTEHVAKEGDFERMDIGAHISYQGVHHRH